MKTAILSLLVYGLTPWIVDSSNCLYPGEKLIPAECLSSNSGAVSLCYKEDGYLAISRGEWATAVNKEKPDSVGYASLELNGNFNLYNSNKEVYYTSNSDQASVAYLIVQDDSNVVLYDYNGKVVYETGTSDRTDIGTNKCTTTLLGTYSTQRKLQDGNQDETPEPSPEPSPEPTETPTPEPSPEPTEMPSPAPSETPTPEPSPEPTEKPTPEPSPEPTHLPSPEPSNIPTPVPSPEPTRNPTPVPSSNPSPAPTVVPSEIPSANPTAPTPKPSTLPSPQPSPAPTLKPSPSPSVKPTPSPSAIPTVGPTFVPTPFPTQKPTSPTFVPTTSIPTVAPTPYPTLYLGPVTPSTQGGVWRHSVSTPYPYGVQVNVSAYGTLLNTGGYGYVCSPCYWSEIDTTSMGLNVPTVYGSTYNVWLNTTLNPQRYAQTATAINTPYGCKRSGAFTFIGAFTFLSSSYPNGYSGASTCVWPCIIVGGWGDSDVIWDPASLASGVQDYNTNNGINWYFTSTSAMGFAPAGSLIYVSSGQDNCGLSLNNPTYCGPAAATAINGNVMSNYAAAYRLTWQLNNKQYLGGGRAGFAGGLTYNSKIYRSAYTCSPVPTGQPTSRPSDQPTSQPSRLPSSQPSGLPSMQPSSQPSRLPSMQPSSQPSLQPAGRPSSMPSMQPTVTPTGQPSSQPTSVPTTSKPTGKPSMQPSRRPSRQPSGQPSMQPSSEPSAQPSSRPSRRPTVQPSSHPSRQPSQQPSSRPSMQPSSRPTFSPSIQPTSQPSMRPSTQPTKQPSLQPFSRPTALPSDQPSRQPSARPSSHPSMKPSLQPSSRPSKQPSSQPSMQPSLQPTSQPSSMPTHSPTVGVGFHSKSFRAYNYYAYAVLGTRGSVVTWGDRTMGGSPPKIVANQLKRGVKQVVGNKFSFAAITSQSQVVAWGYIEKYTAAAEVESLLNSVNATTIVANDFAFAIIDGNGTVSAFGDPLCGGVIATESTLVQNFLRNNITKQVFASSRAFVALGDNGEWVAWGDAMSGGGESFWSTNKQTVRYVMANRYAFSMIYHWSGGTHQALFSIGHPSYGGGFSLSENVQAVIANSGAFVGLCPKDHKVVTWGYGDFGGNSSAVAAYISDTSSPLFEGVFAVAATDSAYCAQTLTGNLVVWGDPDQGGLWSPFVKSINNIFRVYSTGGAFAAVNTSGYVYAWGDSDSGGYIPYFTQAKLAANVTSIFSTWRAFAAVKADGSVVSWGNEFDGGTLGSQQLHNVNHICSNHVSFLAIFNPNTTRVYNPKIRAKNGLNYTVPAYPWGNHDMGGNFHSVLPRLQNMSFFGGLKSC